jgi:hypothetical protein
VPLAFAVFVLIFGLGSIVITQAQVAHPWLDSASVILIVGACLFVQTRSGPLRGDFRPIEIAIGIALCLAGLGVSTWSNVDSTLHIQYWWAPVGVAVFIATMGPYSSARAVIAYGSGFTVVTAIAGFIAFMAPESIWPPISTIVIAMNVVIVATVATAVFCYVLVSHTQRTLAMQSIAVEPSSSRRDDAVSRVEKRTVARLGARVAPFLEELAESGTVTDADRALAGQLARKLRTDLVQQANRSWLDRIAENGRIFIVDPDQRAEHMNHAQRSALRGLVFAVLRNPATDAGSLFIELRGQEDGSTAVAVSVDLDLPEGHRTMLLAPYYLALKSTVDGMRYEPARELLRFNLPGATP